MIGISPIIKDYSSTSWDGATFSTENPKFVVVDFEIGEELGRGAFLFQLLVCNLPWAETEISGRGFFFMRRAIIVDIFEIDIIKAAVQEKIVEFAPYHSWPDFAAKLSPFLRWEFDGKPYPPGY